MMHRSSSQLSRHVNFFCQTQAPSQPFQLITPSWPLQRWGINIVGPLTTAQGDYKYAVVAVEYFRKWIEVKPLVNIAVAGIKRFFWQNIICHFGVPKKIIVDNAKQFDYHIFKDFCHQMGGAKQSSRRCITLNRSSGKGEHNDLHRHKEDTRGSAKRQMG
jgi:hypothetical protein